MLSGVIYYGPKSEIGTVTENTDYGIFGTVSQTFLKEHRTASMEAARRQEVKQDLPWCVPASQGR